MHFINSIKVILTFIFTLPVATSFAQVDKNLNASEAFRILRFLASDELRGRKTGTPEIDKAADFISEEFKKVGLQFFPGLQSFKQTFGRVRVKQLSAEALLDGNPAKESDIIAITSDTLIQFTAASAFKKIVLANAENMLRDANEILSLKQNAVVFVSGSSSKEFNGLKRLKRDAEQTNFSVVFIMCNNAPSVYDVQIKNKVSAMLFTNVVGVLPGKSKKEEQVIFSAHYDHLGTGKPNAAGDSVYNGANDDAAGTTAVIMLADYFAHKNDNERTLVFVAFTAEEIGGFGSQYFSAHTDPDKIVAMFNLEMIGTESNRGKNSAYITGYEKSDLGKILQKNLEGTVFTFEPDPYPYQNLFYRSDNATLAALGVPAHTISTSKMDSEPNYHKLSDEVSTLDMNNMAEIIKAIAISSTSIISGKDTPSRVEKIK